MDQNIGTLHATNGMLDTDANATQGGIGRSLLLAPLRVGVLVTLARLLRRDVQLITTGISWNASRAEIDTNMQIGQPIHLRWKLVFPPEGVVMVTAQGPPQKDHKRVRQRPNRVLQRRLFFS